jgi:hypothetical protein
MPFRTSYKVEATVPGSKSKRGGRDSTQRSRALSRLHLRERFPWSNGAPGNWLRLVGPPSVSGPSAQRLGSFGRADPRNEDGRAGFGFVLARRGSRPLRATSNEARECVAGCQIGFVLREAPSRLDRGPGIVTAALGIWVRSARLESTATAGPPRRPFTEPILLSRVE